MFSLPFYWKLKFIGPGLQSLFIEIFNFAKNITIITGRQNKSCFFFQDKDSKFIFLKPGSTSMVPLDIYSVMYFPMSPLSKPAIATSL